MIWCKKKSSHEIIDFIQLSLALFIKKQLIANNCAILSTPFSLLSGRSHPTGSRRKQQFYSLLKSPNLSSLRTNLSACLTMHFEVKCIFNTQWKLFLENKKLEGSRKYKRGRESKRARSQWKFSLLKKPRILNAKHLPRPYKNNRKTMFKSKCIYLWLEYIRADSMFAG